MTEGGHICRSTQTNKNKTFEIFRGNMKLVLFSGWWSLNILNYRSK